MVCTATKSEYLDFLTWCFIQLSVGWACHVILGVFLIGQISLVAGKSVIIESLASLASSVFCYCSNINVSEDKRREGVRDNS